MELAGDGVTQGRTFPPPTHSLCAPRRNAQTCTYNICPHRLPAFASISASASTCPLTRFTTGPSCKTVHVSTVQYAAASPLLNHHGIRLEPLKPCHDAPVELTPRESCVCCHFIFSFVQALPLGGLSTHRVSQPATTTSLKSPHRFFHTKPYRTRQSTNNPHRRIMPTPNLFVALQTAINPRRWGPTQKNSSTSATSLNTIEHWNTPVPGTYQYKPGQGWYLTCLDADPSQPARPERVVDVVALDRALLISEYYRRSKKAPLPGAPAGSPDVNFVRCDDGIAWVNDKDENGRATAGPWQRFVVDRETGALRSMCKGDDPAWQSRRNSPSHSSRNSLKDGVSAGTRSGGNSKHNSKSSIDVERLYRQLEMETGGKGRPRANNVRADGSRSAPLSRAHSPVSSPGSRRSRPESLLSPMSRDQSATRCGSVEGQNGSGSKSPAQSRPASMISSPLATPGFVPDQEDHASAGIDGKATSGAKEVH